MVAYIGATSVTFEKVDAKVCDFKPAGSAKLVRVTVKNNVNNVFDTDKAHFSGTGVTGIAEAAFLAVGNALIEFRKGSTVVSLQQQSALPPARSNNSKTSLARRPRAPDGLTAMKRSPSPAPG
jgi:hypothetical protein